MDLAGLLLDEEGAFSLTGFQDFSVSALPASPPASPHRGPGPSGATSAPDSPPGRWEAAALAVLTRPGWLGPGERASGYRIEVRGGWPARAFPPRTSLGESSVEEGLAPVAGLLLARQPESTGLGGASDRLAESETGLRPRTPV